MKAVILAGGYGTRLSEETTDRPKPLVEIGGMPILWHIMKYFSSYNINDFIICCGYKSFMIKQFFFNYKFYKSDFSINLKTEKIKLIDSKVENWNIKLVDTGKDTLTGGRVKRIKKFLKKNENFFLTYGDGLTDADLKKEMTFHKKNKKLATILAVNSPGRFGNLEIVKNKVNSFQEKPIKSNNDFINGGYMIMNSNSLNYIKGDSSSLEGELLPLLAKKNQLHSFKHFGFWEPMDTLRDKNKLESLWSSGKAPWKNWK